MTARWFPKADYKGAFNHAVNQARQLNGRFEIGLEVFSEFGKPGYRSGFILPKPQNRCGFELRCQVVTANEPLMS